MDELEEAHIFISRYNRVDSNYKAFEIMELSYVDQGVHSAREMEQRSRALRSMDSAHTGPQSLQFSQKHVAAASGFRQLCITGVTYSPETLV